jgi:predicted transcriptional regulator of viral defense system
MAPQTQARRRERELALLADRQHGVVSHANLIDLGFKPGAIKRRTEAGRLFAVHRGAYAVGRSALDRRGRWMAAVLACGDGAVLSHRSAATHLGLLRSRPSNVDVTSRHGRAGRVGITLHECQIEDDEVTVRDRIPTTSPARTLFDLSECVPGDRLKAACEEADRLGLLEMKELEQVVERGWGRHALKPIRPILADASYPEKTRSPLEGAFLAFCHDRQLPTPVANTEILGYEVDALWPARRLVAELDSWAYHAHRAAFERDRARDASLLLAGYRTIRVTHRRLHEEPATLADEIRTLLDVPELRAP